MVVIFIAIKLYMISTDTYFKNFNPLKQTKFMKLLWSNLYKWENWEMEENGLVWAHTEWIGYLNLILLGFC
jgi:hypothetical protein